MARSVLIFGAIYLAIIFMAATVSSSRIMTITIAEDAENPQTQSCKQQFQQAKQLRSCQQLLRQGAQSEQGQREVQKCCKQLERIQDPQCRCEGLRHVFQQEEQIGQMQGTEKQQMLQTAQNLPALCGLSPQRCEIQTRSLF